MQERSIQQRQAKRESRSQLLVELYKVLQGETLLRVGENHKLFLFKMTSSGALFAYVLNTNGPRAGSIIAPFLAVMVDLLIIKNLILIGTIGAFIANNIERNYLSIGFETAIQHGLLGRRNGKNVYTWLLEWLIINCSTIVIYLATASILYQNNSFKNHWILTAFVASGVLIFLSFMYSTVLLLIKANPDRGPQWITKWFVTIRA